MSTPQRPQLPPAVIEALKNGNKLEAMKLLRQAASAGLTDPKSMVDALEGVKAKLPRAGGAQGFRHVHTAPTYHSRPGLSPGEVPRSGSAIAWVVMLAVGASIVAYVLASL